MRNKKNTYLEKTVGVAIFSALAVVIALACSAIPKVQGFLSLDVKDAVISIAAFIYGPTAGVLIAFIAAFIEFLTFSTTAWYGFIMNFASSAVFALVAASIYKFRRTLNGALAGYLLAVIATTGVMLLLNNYVTPVYLMEFMKMPESVASQTVVELLPKVLLPFNLAKSILNASIAMLIYKPIVIALRRSGIASGGKNGVTFNRASVVIIAVGLAAMTTALTILFIIW